mgnify:CR=1 FL=1
MSVIFLARGDDQHQLFGAVDDFVVDLVAGYALANLPAQVVFQIIEARADEEFEGDVLGGGAYDAQTQTKRQGQDKQHGKQFFHVIETPFAF